MSSKEYVKYFSSIASAINNIENETKDFVACDFMAIMSTAIDVYAKTHGMPAIELWTAMYEAARAVNEVMPL